MRRWGKIIDDFEENFLFFMLFAMVVTIFLQVVMRYVFQSSLSWSEEVGAMFSYGSPGYQPDMRYAKNATFV